MRQAGLCKVANRVSGRRRDRWWRLGRPTQRVGHDRSPAEGGIPAGALVLTHFEHDYFMNLAEISSPPTNGYSSARLVRLVSQLKVVTVADDLHLRVIPLIGPNGEDIADR